MTFLVSTHSEERAEESFDVLPSFLKISPKHLVRFMSLKASRSGLSVECTLQSEQFTSDKPSSLFQAKSSVQEKKPQAEQTCSIALDDDARHKPSSTLQANHEIRGSACTSCTNDRIVLDIALQHAHRRHRKVGCSVMTSPKLSDTYCTKNNAFVS